MQNGVDPIKPLKTDRLILRAFQENDYESVYAYTNSIDYVNYKIWGPNAEGDTCDFLKKTIENYDVEPLLEFSFAVTIKETGQLIGGCNILKNPLHNDAMIGWILHRDYWQLGFGSELAHELLRFGFEELKIHRIWAACDSENYNTCRVMERNKMRKEGHFIKNCSARGQWRGEFIYAILDEEWQVLSKAIS